MENQKSWREKNHPFPTPLENLYFTEFCVFLSLFAALKIYILFIEMFMPGLYLVPFSPPLLDKTQGFLMLWACLMHAVRGHVIISSGGCKVA